MSTPVAFARRLAAGCAAVLLCAVLAIGPGQPTAQAAAQDQLAAAIARTPGSYLVYNFGSGHPTPMLNAAGDWYEMSGGGHLVVLKSASQRIEPHLLVDSHSGAQSRCERDPRARTSEG